MFTSTVAGVKAFSESLIAKLNNQGEADKANRTEKPMVFFNEVDRRPLVKNLGNWVEKEGFLFFDSMLVPHPAGFKVEHGLYAYTEALIDKLKDFRSIESLIDVGIREVAACVSDPERTEAKSFRFPNLKRLDNGATSQSMTTFFMVYFDGTKSSDKAPFTDLFRNASELNKTALELERLIKEVNGTSVQRLNDKVARLASLALELNQIIVEDTDRQRHDVIAQMRDNVISPLAEWCEAMSIYLYQVNTLKVCFSDIEAHIQKIKK